MNATERDESRLRTGRRIFRRPVGRFALVSVAASILLAACTTDIPQNSLDPASPQARDIDNLWWLVFWIAVVVFVLVEVVVFVAGHEEVVVGEDAKRTNPVGRDLRRQCLRWIHPNVCRRGDELELDLPVL